MSTDDLRALHAKLDEIREQLHQHGALLESWSRRIDRLEGEIWGNGQAGLAVRVRALLWLASGMAGMLGLILAQIVVQWLR